MPYQLSQAALADLASSGLCREMIGVRALDAVMQDVMPLDIDLLTKYFGRDSMIWAYEKVSGAKRLRLKDGYVWGYGGSIRLKNLDPDFIVTVKGVPDIDKNGKIKVHRYLSPKGEPPHLYLSPSDKTAAASKLSRLWFIEGEKKRWLLASLLSLLPQFTRMSHINTDTPHAVIGLQGVFCTEGTEMDALTGAPTSEDRAAVDAKEQIPFHTIDFGELPLKNKDLIFVFDADSLINPSVAQAELRLVGLMFMKGAQLERMKSPEWDSGRGKGLDDYLVNVYKSEFLDQPVFSETGKPLFAEHPMLTALNTLVKAASHPIKKFARLGYGLDFVVRALTSGVKTGDVIMTDVMKEELAALLKREVFKGISKSVILRTITSQIKNHSFEKSMVVDTMTELRLSEIFAEVNAGYLKWNPQVERWYWFDGKVWRRDHKNGGKAVTAAKQLLRSAADHFDLGDAELTAFRMKLRQMESQPVLDRIVAHAATIETMIKNETDFDTNPLLLNLKNCVYDFERNAAYAHTPDQYHSKIANVEYQPNAICPRWIAFLNTIFQNIPYVDVDAMAEISANLPLDVSSVIEDLVGVTGLSEQEWVGILNSIPNLHPSHRQFLDMRCRRYYDKVLFLQKCLGLSLTGLSNEKMFLFCFGSTGDNGKSTIFNVFERIFLKYGDPQELSYFVRIPVSSLLARQVGGGGGINDALADLRGARMVCTDEFSDGYIDVSIIKNLTGAEQIMTRRPHEHTIRFFPTWTIWGFGNQFPRINVQRDPIWTRLKLLDFPVSLLGLSQRGEFTMKEMTTVIAEFMEEGPGILNWAIRGYHAYRLEGLNVPECVKHDTSMYRQDQDTVSDYFIERIVSLPTLKVSRAELWKDYCEWCEVMKLKPKQRNIFWSEVEYRPGVFRHESGNTVWFKGIGLKSADHTPPPPPPIEGSGQNYQPLTASTGAGLLRTF